MIKIYKFYSDSCGPCKLVEKQLTDSDIEHINVNINNENKANMLEEFSIKTVPTVIAVDDNNTVKFSKIGVFNKLNINDLKQIIKKYS